MKIASLSEIERDEYDITLFISCYQEEKYVYDTLVSVHNALCESGLKFEILIIDDHSKDRSIERVKDFQREFPDCPLRVYLNERNCGLAFNFVEAAYLGKGKYFRLLCGDNSEPKEASLGVFAEIGKADMIIPYPVSTGRTFFRQAISKMYVFIVNCITGNRLRYYNGAPVFRRSHVVRFHPYSHGFGFQADLVSRLLDNGCSYREVRSWTIENKMDLSTALTFRNLLSVLHTFIELGLRRGRAIVFGRDRILE